MQTITCQIASKYRLSNYAFLPWSLCGEVVQFIEFLPQKKGHLTIVLYKAQSVFGYISMEVQQFVADCMEVPLAKVKEIVNFYNFFTMTPKGKYPISVCMDTTCLLKGADKLLYAFQEQLKIDLGETTPDGKFSIDTLRCAGGCCCALAPIVLIGDKVYANVTPGQVNNILSNY